MQHHTNTALFTTVSSVVGGVGKARAKIQSENVERERFAGLNPAKQSAWSFLFCTFDK
jgi:hypothetical protein